MVHARPPRRFVALLLFASLAGLFGACRSVPLVGGDGKQKEEEAMQKNLRLQLELFSTQFTTRFQDVVDSVLSADPPPQLEREVLTTRLEVVTTFRALLEHPDARIVFLDMWAFCVQLGHRVDERTSLTPTVRDEVQNVAADLVARIRGIGTTFIPPKELDTVAADIDAFAASHPLGQRFTTFYAQRSKEKGAIGTVSGIVTAPLGAINPFGGIDATAAAIHAASDVGDRFATIVERLPDVLRWEVELLVFDVLNSEQTLGLLASIDQVSRTTAGIEGSIATLPDDLTRVLKDTESTQESLRGTLTELNGTLERVDPIVHSVERTTRGVADAGTAWEGTTRAVQELVASFSSDEEEGEEAAPAEPEEPGEPFRILDYAETAEQLTAAAAQLTTLVSEVRGVITNEELRLVTEAAGDTVNAAVDHVVFRIIEVVIVLLAAIVLLRVFWNRTRPAPDVG